MRAPSGQWFKDIADTRDAPWDGLSGPKSPVMPWIHPVLHPEIKSLIERWGVERTLAPKDPVLGTSERVDQLVMVKSGITARCVSSPFAQSRLSVAIGLPGRLACGNLNFFTGRPCVGRYFALVPSVVVSVPQELVMSLAKKNTEFLLLIAAQFELAALSDRLGFAAETLLDIDERVLAFFMSWASVYGKLTEIDGETWVDMPHILRGEALRYVVNCSSAALERSMTSLKKKGLVVSEADRFRVKLEILKPVHQWLRSAEEASRLFTGS